MGILFQVTALRRWHQINYRLHHHVRLGTCTLYMHLIFYITAYSEHCTRHKQIEKKSFLNFKAAF